MDNPPFVDDLALAIGDGDFPGSYVGVYCQVSAGFLRSFHSVLLVPMATPL